MSENLRLESLNCRGLRDKTKRADIFERIKDRKTDIILLQETHLTENDYTELKEDWNIEYFLSGSSNTSRGTAILLNKTFEYVLHDKILDDNGRYTLIDIEITLIGRLTVGSIYAPNDQIEIFLEEIFDKINQLNNVFNAIGGDWNMIQDFKLDTYNYDRWNNKTASKRLEEKKVEYDLVDIWRIKNGNNKRFSWWKKTPRKAGRLDFFLVSDQLTTRIGDTEILSPYKSDHGTISIEIILSEEKRGIGSWKLNTDLLKDTELQDKIREEIKLIKRTYALTPYNQINLEENELEIEYSIKADLLWEVMLTQIRGIIIDHAKKKKRKEKKREKELITEIDTLSEDMQQNIERIEILNIELTGLREERIKGAQIRARSLKLNEGEKPSSYFLSLEKANYINKSMLEIHDLKDKLIKNRDGILKAQKDFYQKLYSSGNTTNLDQSPLNWVTQHMRKLNNTKKEKLEENINLTEIETVLFKMKNNKSPGPDGYSYEFFKIFWENLKFLMLNTFNEYLDSKRINGQQNLGIITCLPKQGKDRRYMKNWRPITLLNSTYKIFSGLLAERLRSTLEELIHNDQKGFVQNRFIGENIRLIHDIMTECETTNTTGFMILVDFEKAFDTLDWKFIQKTFELCNFGEKILNWIKILQNGSKAIVSQNGYFSEPINLQRGCRQGDPVSPYIFVICAEILGIAISENKNIEGLTIFGYEHKISQYADDTTLITKNCKKCLNRVLDTLKDFHLVSGLKVNIEKTKVVQLGVARDGRMIGLENGKLELTNEFVLLGIHFNTNELNKITDNNCKLKFPKMRKILRQWKRRRLTLNGKISVFKSLASSMITHTLLSLPDPSPPLLDELEQITNDFLWGTKPPKFRKEILEYPHELGGLQLHNPKRFSSSLKLTWLRRIILTDSGWTNFALAYEIDKCWMYGNDFTVQKLKTTTNRFWKDVIQSIIDLRSVLTPITDQDYLCWPLWYDQTLKLPIIKKLQKKNVYMIADLLDRSWEIMTKEEIERSKNVTLNFLEYMSIKQSIKDFIKNAKKQIENTGPYRPYLLNIVFSEKKGCQNLYRKTGQYGNKILIEISQKWDIDILQDTEAEEVKQSIRTFRKTTRNMYLWDIQYKLWFGRVATNARLFRMNIKESDNCEFCQQIETNAHAFILCERARNLWSDINTFLTEIGYRNFRLEHQILIFGDTEMDPLFNLIIIIAKKLIYQNRGKGNIYSLMHFKALLEIERESEEIYANENDKTEQYERRWEKYLTIY